ncbi:MAG: hypothetical protein Q7R87_00995 [Nanoarchaeota archaeon]|nr:hypothetical protein [Nanoarchaeota archaeon]
MVNIVNYRLVVLSMLFVLLLGFASAELNLKITASVNGLSSDFNAITDPFADKGFDGSDVPFITPPSNYISLYSNITLQNGVNKLVLDAWNQSSNPRVLTLTLTTSAAQAGNLDITWTGANNYSVVLNDYAGDSLRRTPVTGGATTLSAGTGSGTYSVPSFSSSANGVRYFTLVVTNTTTSTTDTTPPGPVTNLGYQYKTKSNIFWVWANPTNSSDFDVAIVYADGINVANTSLAKYNATGLAANTSHNIRINTKDFAGNVNYLNVTSNTTTSASSSTRPLINPNPPLGPGVGTVTPLGPGPGGAGTGTIANPGSSGIGGIPGEEIPLAGNETATDKLIQKTKDSLLDFLSKKANVYILSGIIFILLIVWIVAFIVKKRKLSIHKHTEKNSKKR